MKFVLVDKIENLVLGKELSASKSVSLAEEYLGDHFPAFPVLPGVLLLEGMIESAAWLVRKTENFAHSMVLLEQARNVKYKSFAAPGMKIVYRATAKAIEQNVSSFTAEGIADGQSIVEAKFSLKHYNLADNDPKMATTDGLIIQNFKNRWKILTQHTDIKE